MARSTTSTDKTTAVRFAGIDYHKRFSIVTLGDCSGTVVRSGIRIPNDKHQLKRFFADYPGIECAVESCRGYEWFVDYLKELGLIVHLSNPYRTKLMVETRCKTDKVDSTKLMELIAIGFLPTCYQPTAEERTLRERLRWRSSLVRQSTSIKVKIHSLLDKENLGVGVQRLFTQAGREFIGNVPLSEPRKALLVEHMNLLGVFDDMLNSEQREINRMLKSNRKAQLLETIPGIGPINALLLVSEIGDISRFSNSGKLAGYFGMVPKVSASADHYRIGRLTKQGSSHVRWMVNQAAWVAVQRSEVFAFHYRMVAARRGKQAAICSVARKLIRIVFRVLRDERPYEAQLVGRSPSA
jgi:transposase